MRTARHLIVLGFAGLLGAFAPRVQADQVYCVDSLTSLQAALVLAEIDAGDSDVRLVRGSYSGSTYSAPLRYNGDSRGGKLTLRGGWNGDCSQTSGRVSDTEITAVSGYPFLIFEANDGDISLADLILDQVDVYVGSSIEDWCLGGSGLLLARRLLLREAGLRVRTGSCRSVRVENSIFQDGPLSALGYGNVGLDIGWSLLPAELVNLTFDAARVTVSGSELRIYNSILQAPGADVVALLSDVFVRHSRFDQIEFDGEYGGLLAGSGANTADDPQLAANLSPLAGSPMIDSGTPTVPQGLPATDLIGNDRVAGQQVDRGARESQFSGGAVFTVTSTANAGSGSLRDAVDAANDAPGFNRIEFALAGTCPRVISLASAVQVREQLLIDGWSQPGSVRNASTVGWDAAPCVVLQGAGGIGLEAMADLGSQRLEVRGLAFGGFDLALALAFGSDHGIHGNQFGGQVGDSAIVLPPNDQAIGLIGGGRSVIGGWDAAERNLISGSTDVGVLVTTFLGAGGDHNQIINNVIGFDKDARSALPNGTGIRINGGFNQVLNNRIGGNAQDGILLSGSSAEGNRIAGNAIGGGIGRLSLTAGNARMGVMLQGDAHDNQIGPGNQIGANGDSGVRVMSSAGGRNRITANAIGGNDAPGIDLGANGVTPNDTDGALCNVEIGCSGNRGQNYPVLEDAMLVSGITPVGLPYRIRGRLTSLVAATPYRVELFASHACDPSGHGQGTTYLGSTEVLVEQSGFCLQNNCSASFSAWLPAGRVEEGQSITATATSPAGDTSEFSACITAAAQDTGPVVFASGFESP